jgi:excisionase family DNA binding protein
VIELPPGESLPVYLIARVLSIHRDHLLHLIEAGELPAIDLRGVGSSRSTIRIARHDLLDFLERRQILGATRKRKN